MERTSSVAKEEAIVPQDALTMQKILRSMGVEDYEPRVIQQLLDFMYRHVTDVLEDAECYAMHAGKERGDVDLSDVRLALRAKDRFGFCQAPSRDVVMQLAKERNKVPIPELSRAPGLRLPRDPPHSTLLTPNYEAFPSKTRSSKSNQEEKQ